MVHILITGANGRLAEEVIKKLKNDNFLYLFSRKIEMLKAKYKDYKNIKSYSYEDLNDFHKNIDILFHCAFSRSSNKELLHDSVELTLKIFKKAVALGCKRVINISSIAVYDTRKNKKWTELDIPTSFDEYGNNKLIVENELSKLSKNLSYINIRLSALCGKKYPEHILYKLVNNAVEKEEININNPNLNFTFINYRDAINAVVLFFNLDYLPKYRIYNIGNNKTYNIIDIAQTIQQFLANYGKNVSIKISKSKTNEYLYSDMSSSRFMEEFSWYPQYSLEKSICEIFETIYKQKL